MDQQVPFTVGRSTIFKSFLLSPITGWPTWAVFFAGLLLVAAGAIFDYHILLFGLIVSLSIAPMVALFLFVNFMLGSEMVANLLNHTVERRPSSYVIHIFRPADKSNPIEEGKDWIESGRLTVFEYNIINRRFTRDYEILFLKDSPLKMLYVKR